MYGRAFVHVLVTAWVISLMRELRRGTGSVFVSRSPYGGLEVDLRMDLFEMLAFVGN
jgi:hypothetical protein